MMYQVAIVHLLIVSAKSTPYRHASLFETRKGKGLCGTPKDLIAELWVLIYL